MITKFLNTNGINKTKGWYSLLLALLLVFSISAKSISFVHALSNQSFKLEKATSKQGKIISVQESSDEDEELVELDIDDEDDLEKGHYLTTTNYFQSLDSAIELTRVVRPTTPFLGTSYKNPLYILYCKWKFHLS